MVDSISSKNMKTTTIPKDSKSKVKSSDAIGMETDQAEQLMWLNALLNQYVKVLTRSHVTYGKAERTHF